MILAHGYGYGMAQELNVCYVGNQAGFWELPPAQERTTVEFDTFLTTL